MPAKPTSHSASMEPTIAPGTEIRIAARNSGSAAGIRTLTSAVSAASDSSAEGVPVNLEVLYGQSTCAVGHREHRETETAKTIHVPLAPREFRVPPIPQTHKPSPPPPPAPPSRLVEKDFRPTIEVPAATLVEPAPEVFSPASEADPLVTRWAAAEQAAADAHAAFLKFSEGMQSTFALEHAFAQSLPADALALAEPQPHVRVAVAPPAPAPTRVVVAPPEVVPTSLTREQCMEFAVGEIGRAHV